MELTEKEKSHYERNLGETNNALLREVEARCEKPVETDFPGHCRVEQKMREVSVESSRNLRYSAVYRITRPFSVKRIGRYYKNPAKKIQEYAKSREQSQGIYTTVLHLKKMCEAAYLDLAVTVRTINN